jgi:hypothetical protein
MWSVVATEFFKIRVPPDVKRRVAAAAQRKLLTESAWLRSVVLRELALVDATDSELIADQAAAVARPCRTQKGEGTSSARVYVRLRIDDRLLLDARAEARGMRPATYLSVLTRSHLRQVTPLPQKEYVALRHSMNELTAIGRNINQMAKVANQDGRLPGSLREEFRAILRICEGLRDHTKVLLTANLASWKCGYPSEHSE